MGKNTRNRVLYDLTPTQRLMRVSEIITLDKKHAAEGNALGFELKLFDDEHTSKQKLEALEKAYNFTVLHNDALRLSMEFSPLHLTRQYVRDYEYEHIERLEFNDEKAADDFCDGLYGYPPYWKDKNLIWKKLIVVGGKNVRLIGRIHHVIFDGYSFLLFNDMIKRSYWAYVNGEEPTPPKKNYSYLDFIESCKKYAGTEQKKKDRKYFWDKYHSQRNYSIPGGKRSQDNSSERLYRHIDPETTEKVRDMAKRFGCSCQTFLMACAALTTYAVTGEDNFNIYTMFHGRRTASEKHTMGAMLNTVPVFYDIHRGENLDIFFSKCTENYFEALTHGRFPVVESFPCTYLESAKNGFNFAHLWLTFNEIGFDVDTVDRGFKIRELKMNGNTSQMQMVLFNGEGKPFRLEFIYQTHRYSRELMEKCLELYETIIKDAVELLSEEKENVKVAELVDKYRGGK